MEIVIMSMFDRTLCLRGRAAILPYGTQNQQTDQHRRPTLVHQCPLVLRRSMVLVVVCYSGA